MHFVQAKGILSAKNGMNLYRGCTHGCIYCDSRSECYRFAHDFEDIEIKENAIDLLEDALSRKRNKCMIGTGSMTDPYMQLEEKIGMTRTALETGFYSDNKIAAGTARPRSFTSDKQQSEMRRADDAYDIRRRFVQNTRAECRRYERTVCGAQNPARLRYPHRCVAHADSSVYQ